MCVFDHPEFDNHEQVLFCHDAATGLHAIIAVHSTVLGPAVGGCRIHPYPNGDAALTDVLRLSKGMTHKNALAGLPLGGGKAVIIADPRRDKTPELLHAFARHVQSLGGRYYTAEDVGVSVDDIATIREVTQYVAGATRDPSPFTARGVFEAMRAAVKHHRGSDSMAGVKVAVQGLGHVGMRLCEVLHDAGAVLFVADVNEQAVNEAVEHFGAVAVDPSQIHALEVDIFAPCAMGGIINDTTIRDLKALMIVGAANNQLAEARHGHALKNLGILYAPDYVVNAGGILSVAGSVVPEYDEAMMLTRVCGIHDTMLHILEQSKAEDRPTSEIADMLAQKKLTEHKHHHAEQDRA